MHPVAITAAVLKDFPSSRRQLPNRRRLFSFQPPSFSPTAVGCAPTAVGSSAIGRLQPPSVDSNRRWSLWPQGPMQRTSLGGLTGCPLNRDAGHVPNRRVHPRLTNPFPGRPASAVISCRAAWPPACETRPSVPPLHIPARQAP